jgi:hypothetical protein
MVTIPDFEEVDITERTFRPPVMDPVIEIPPEPISAYELDSERKSSPPVLARRKELQTYVASFVGVAWFICLFAVGQTALRSLIASVVR